MKAFLLRCIEYLNRARLRSLGDRVTLGEGTRLLNGFSIRFLASPKERRYLDIGTNCTLSAKIIFESTTGSVVIGERCYIGPGSTIICRSRIQIGNDVTLAWGITLYDHDSHSLDWKQRAKVVAHFHRYYGRPSCFDTLDWAGVKTAPIVIADRAWLGFDVIVLKGVTIGEGAIVGARSVVTRDVEPYTVVAGNPARIIRRVSEAAPGIQAAR